MIQTTDRLFTVIRLNPAGGAELRALLLEFTQHNHGFVNLSSHTEQRGLTVKGGTQFKSVELSLDVAHREQAKMSAPVMQRSVYGLRIRHVQV